MSDDFDPYYTWLGIPANDQPPNHYRLLGVQPFEDNPDVISNAADQRMAHVRTFQTGKRARYSQRVLNELAAASVQLLDPEKKLAYDTKLKAELQSPPSKPVLASADERIIIAPTELDEDDPEYQLAPMIDTVKQQLLADKQASAASEDSINVADLDDVNHSSRDPLADAIAVERSLAKPDTAALPKTRAPASSNPTPVLSDRQTIAPSTKMIIATVVGSLVGFILLGALIVYLVTRGGKQPVAVNPAPPGETDPATSADPTGPESNPTPPASTESEPNPESAPVPPAVETEDDPASDTATAEIPTADPPVALPVDPTPIDPPPIDPPPIDPPSTDPPPVDPPASDPLAAPPVPEPIEPPSQDAPEPEPAPSRAPVPNGVELAEARSLIEETMQADIAGVNTLQGRRNLADKLWQQSRVSLSLPVQQYALLQMSAEYAARVPHLSKAWRAWDEMAEHFETSVILEKETVLRRCVDAAKNDNNKSPADFILLTKAWIRLFEEAVDEDQYRVAERYAMEANQLAKLSFDDDFKSYVQEGLEAVKQLADAADALGPAWEQVEASAEDAESARKVGRFYCTFKDDWQAGLPLWSRGGAAGLAPMAKLDLREPTDLEFQLELADAWWAEAESSSFAFPRRFLKKRAAYWYQQVLPHMDPADLRRVQILARLKDSASIEVRAVSGKAFDVQSMFDLTQFKSTRAVARRKTAIYVNTASAVRVQAPLTVDGEYVLTGCFRRVEGEHGFGIEFPVGREHAVRWTVGDAATATKRLDGLPTDAQERLRQEQADAIAVDQFHYFRIHVLPSETTARIAVQLDGRDDILWEGETSALSATFSFDGIGIFADGPSKIEFSSLYLLTPSNRIAPILR